VVICAWVLFLAIPSVFPPLFCFARLKLRSTACLSCLRFVFFLVVLFCCWFWLFVITYSVGFPLHHSVARWGGGFVWTQVSESVPVFFVVFVLVVGLILCFMPPPHRGDPGPSRPSRWVVGAVCSPARDHAIATAAATIPDTCAVLVGWRSCFIFIADRVVDESLLCICPDASHSTGERFL